ncbi:MAG: exonuclease subunit SbcD [Synergistaceae bacterium]|jgi:exonuclease SbcD|nr:exonuclease subunit SbcD [Synergistaceae bacterium]
MVLRAQMKILHTSDWHLGRAFYGRKRNDEHEAFLGWLVSVVNEHNIDAVLVAGDIFDNGSPSNKAQALYYSFIREVAASSCRHVVIIGGNHDSPSFLDAPKELLRIFNVHVVSCVPDDPMDEVLLLEDDDGRPELVVCAVPYLRDWDVRLSGAGESASDKEALQAKGTAEHYAVVEAAAESLREKLGKNGTKIPVVVMGHIFAAGGVPGDTEKAAYVGTLPQVPHGIFSQRVMPDYVALGHLHTPQVVGGDETVRYSGSPLSISFAEAGQKKFVHIVEFGENGTNVTPLEAPAFRRVVSLRGGWREIREQTAALRPSSEQDKAGFSEIWAEVVYEGNDINGDLRSLVEAEVETFNLECSAKPSGPTLDVLRVRDKSAGKTVVSRLAGGEILGELDPRDIFRRLMDANDVPEDHREGLMTTYEEVLLSLEGLADAAPGREADL